MRCGVAAGAALLLLALPAAAEDPFGRPGARLEPPAGPATTPTGADGVYGRFDGDLALSLGGGAEFGFDALEARLLGAAALRYYSLVGLYATYREGLSEDDTLVRGLSAGLLLEPMFLLRWSEGRTLGSAFWDLTVDSVSLSFGAHLGQPRGLGFAEERGLELGLGGGVPLLGWAEGAWLRARGLIRFREDGGSEPVLWLTAEWQTFFESGLVGAMGRGR
jgi:hypothetical protein